MFKRILVPLDGSLRAERALAVAARLARTADGTVVLLQAVGIPPEYSTYLYGPYLAQPNVQGEDVLEAKEAAAKAYIETVRQSDKLAGVKVETKVVVGAAALAIQDIASEENVDLIAMCSHGDTGFKRGFDEIKHPVQRQIRPQLGPHRPRGGPPRLPALLARARQARGRGT